MSKAISTINTVLKSAETPTTGEPKFTKLCNIIDYPTLGGAPEKLQTTDLSSYMHTYIYGVQNTEDLVFTLNFTKEKFLEITNKLKTHTHFKLEFGESGADGTFEWQGEGVVIPEGGSVNGVRQMKLHLAPSTTITFK